MGNKISSPEKGVPPPRQVIPRRDKWNKPLDLGELMFGILPFNIDESEPTVDDPPPIVITDSPSSTPCPTPGSTPIYIQEETINIDMADVGFTPIQWEESTQQGNMAEQFPLPMPANPNAPTPVVEYVINTEECNTGSQGVVSPTLPDTADMQAQHATLMTELQSYGDHVIVESQSQVDYLTQLSEIPSSHVAQISQPENGSHVIPLSQSQDINSNKLDQSQISQSQNCDLDQSQQNGHMMQVDQSQVNPSQNGNVVQLDQSQMIPSQNDNLMQVDQSQINPSQNGHVIQVDQSQMIPSQNGHVIQVDQSQISTSQNGQQNFTNPESQSDESHVGYQNQSEARNINGESQPGHFENSNTEIQQKGQEVIIEVEFSNAEQLIMETQVDSNNPVLQNHGENGENLGGFLNLLNGDNQVMVVDEGQEPPPNLGENWLSSVTTLLNPGTQSEEEIICDGSGTAEKMEEKEGEENRDPVENGGPVEEEGTGDQVDECETDQLEQFEINMAIENAPPERDMAKNQQKEMIKNILKGKAQPSFKNNIQKGKRIGNFNKNINNIENKSINIDSFEQSRKQVIIQRPLLKHGDTITTKDGPKKLVFACKECSSKIRSNYEKDISEVCDSVMTCEKCFKVFCCKAVLSKHICTAYESEKIKEGGREKVIAQSGRVQHACSLCPASFLFPLSLKKHRQEVHGVGGKCSYCNLHFASQASLKQHIADLHESNKYEKYITSLCVAKAPSRPVKKTCDRCPQTFFSDKALQRHYTVVHFASPDMTRADESGSDLSSKAFDSSYGSDVDSIDYENEPKDMKSFLLKRAYNLTNDSPVPRHTPPPAPRLAINRIGAQSSTLHTQRSMQPNGPRYTPRLAINRIKGAHEVAITKRKRKWAASAVRPVLCSSCTLDAQLDKRVVARMYEACKVCGIVLCCGKALQRHMMLLHKEIPESEREEEREEEEEEEEQPDQLSNTVTVKPPPMAEEDNWEVDISPIPKVNKIKVEENGALYAADEDTPNQRGPNRKMHDHEVEPILEKMQKTLASEDKCFQPVYEKFLKDAEKEKSALPEKRAEELKSLTSRMTTRRPLWACDKCKGPYGYIRDWPECEFCQKIMCCASVLEKHMKLKHPSE